MTNAALSKCQANLGFKSTQQFNPFPSFMGALSEFLDGPMQHLNDEIEVGNASINDFLMRWEPIGKLMLSIMSLIPQMGERHGREVLRRLAFVPSSLEYHVQRRGEKPGAGLKLACGLEEALIALGRVAHHVPRDSHDTLWRWNSGKDRIRFTGDEQENIFAHGVIETDRVHSESCAAIRPMCWGIVPLVSPQAADALRCAETNTRYLCDIYVAFRTPRSDWSLKPDFFMKRLRAYLTAYPVGGAMLTGPNAANIGSQVSIDFLTGFGSPAYYERWGKERIKHMTPEDAFQARMDALQAEPISNLVLHALRLPERLFLTLEDYQVAAHIVGQSTEARSSITAFTGFAREQIRLSGIHWSLMKSHLINPGEVLTHEEMAKMPVKHDRGTGQASHEDTHLIFRMRHDQPVVSKLIRAVAMLPEGESYEAGL